MKTFAKVLLTAYLFSMTAYAFTNVGERSSCTVYEADLPLVMFVLLLFPAVLGYTIGKDL